MTFEGVRAWNRIPGLWGRHEWRPHAFVIVTGNVKVIGIVATLILAACDKPPEFPVPAQRPAFTAANLPVGRVFHMDDPGVTHRFVRDISPELSGTWRWAFQKPAVKIRIRTDHPLKYVIDFHFPDFTLKDTGPVTISFTVNEHELDRVRYSTPGDHHFEKPVPPEWIRVNQEAIVGAEIDKMWTAKLDGARFGFILMRIGLAAN